MYHPFGRRNVAEDLAAAVSSHARVVLVLLLAPVLTLAAVERLEALHRHVEGPSSLGGLCAAGGEVGLLVDRSEAERESLVARRHLRVVEGSSSDGMRDGDKEVDRR